MFIFFCLKLKLLEKLSDWFDNNFWFTELREDLFYGNNIIMIKFLSHISVLLLYKSGCQFTFFELLQVSPGMDCVCAQDVVAINAEEKNYCNVAEIGKRAIITPDVDAIISTLAELW